MVLPPEAALWAEGAGIQRLVKPDGVDLLPTFDLALAALADWRAAHT